MNRQQQLDSFSLALHRRAIEALRRDPTLRVRVRGTLARWRSQSGETRSDPLWNQWEDLLNHELSALETAVLSESEHATLMRSVSPLGALVDQAERLTLLREARAQTAGQ